MGAWNYAWNSLRMRKESKILLLGQGLILSITVFSVLLSGILASNLIQLSKGFAVNTSLSHRYAAFSVLVGIVSFIAGLIYFYMTLRTLFQYKKR